MARAHHEAPKAEKPKDISHQFDFSDAESEAKDSAPKKRARTAPPVPVEALRPRKRATKKDETLEALEMVRQTSEESAWDKKFNDAKVKAKKEDSLDDTKNLGQARVEAAPKFEEKEEAWFKQGEDPEHIKAMASKQHEEEGQKIDDVRRQIAETYDDKNRETILDTDEELDAAAKQAQAMIDAGDLDPETFNAKDYRYLLLEQARLDKELEHAGWWKARKLHAEMRETRRQLDGYEGQIQSVMRERARARDEASKPPQKPWSPPLLPREGSGTTVHKPSLFSRLFGKK